MRRDAALVESAKPRKLLKRLEAASGLEPESRGFADLRLNHLATPPRRTTIEDSSGTSKHGRCLPAFGRGWDNPGESSMIRCLGFAAFLAVVTCVGAEVEPSAVQRGPLSEA